MTRKVLFYAVLIISLGISTSYSEVTSMSDQEYKDYIAKYPEFQSAEMKLNQTYKSLISSLSDESKTQLKSQQRQWIKQRDDNAFKVGLKGSPEYINQLIKSTNERAEELKLYSSKSNEPIIADELIISLKNWQATIIRLEGINTSKALAVGEVKFKNAKEYCDRDPGGETKQNGGKLTKEQCIQQVFKEGKGKLYSVSADCPRKTLTNDFGTFTLLGQSSEMGFPQNVWRSNITGENLSGSPSGAPILDEQFKLLCPTFVKPK